MGEKKVRHRDKKPRTGKKHKNVLTHKFYQTKDGLVRTKKSCPRCGPGTWLGEHKNRVVCGRCGYSEVEKPKA